MPATETPAAPTTTQPAPESTDRAPGDFMAAEMADFAAMDQAPAEPAKPSSQPRTDKGKFKAAEKPSKPVTEPEKKPAEEKPVEEPAPAESAKPGETKSPMRALGEKYDELRKQVDHDYKPTIQKLQAEVEQLKQKATDPNLLERVKAAEARAEAAEKRLEVEAFTQSEKYQNEYEKPYVEAYNKAVAQFRELKVKVQDGVDDMGEPIIKVRQADENDLLKIANLSLSEMDQAVTEMFGASASRVIGHIEKLRELADARRNAAMTAKDRATETKKQQQQEAESRTSALASHWTEVNKALEEKFPKAFKVIEGDAEDAAAHTKGFALGNLLFVGERGLTPEQVEALPASFKDTIKAGQPLSDKQRVQLHALARLKMANHDRQIAHIKKLRSRVEQLEKDLEAYEKSEPGGKAGERTQADESGRDWLQTAEAEIRALDK